MYRVSAHCNIVVKLKNSEMISSYLKSADK